MKRYNTCTPIKNFFKSLTMHFIYNVFINLDLSTFLFGYCIINLDIFFIISTVKLVTGFLN